MMYKLNCEEIPGENNNNEIYPNQTENTKLSVHSILTNEIPPKKLIALVAVCVVILVLLIALIIFRVTAGNAREVFQPVKEIVYVEKPPQLKSLYIGESVITDIVAQQKLEVLNVNNENEIILDDSFKINWKIFNRSQKITLNATARYTVNLNDFSRNDIAYDETTERLFILIPRPVLDSVTINEELNQFHEVESGFFRFGDIRITPEDHNEIIRQGKENITNTLKLCIETQSKADQAAKESVTNLISDLLTEVELANYKIEVGFK